MSEFVRVTCNVPNGLVIHTSQEAPGGDGTGERRFVPVETLELKPGVNKVNKKFLSMWLETNSESDVLTHHLIEFDKGELK